MAKNFYVDPEEFRSRWAQWTKSGDDAEWKYLCDSVYKICLGVSSKFGKVDRTELAHHAFAETIAKIKNGREGRKPKILDNGKSSPFNLLTTAISNTLYTLMARRERQKHHHMKYKEQLQHTNKNYDV